MILRSTGSIQIEIIRCELHPWLESRIQSLLYRLRYHKDSQVSGMDIHHRDILNPIFNQTFEFMLTSASKVCFTLYSNYSQLGSAEVSLNSPKRTAQIVSNGREVGILHYRLVLGKSEQKGNGYLKHNKNVESEHYQKEVKKTDRDKSCDVNRSHNISAKCLPTKILPKGVTKDVSGVSNETMLAKKSRDTESIELFSTYFKRKEQPKKQKTSIHTESNESDRRSEQTSKILMLEKELKELVQRKEEVISARKSIKQRLEEYEREEGDSVTSPLQPRPPSLQNLLEDQQQSSLVKQIQELSQYNSHLQLRILRYQSSQ